MNQAELIISAENSFKRLLEEFFSEVWRDTLIYSHDINHHRRVWKFAKELLTVIEPKEPLADKLIIASYLHDLGMSEDPGERHGLISREYCRRFLKKHNLEEEMYSDVLMAIEWHDDKEYKTAGLSGNNVLQLLSVADDLDAFGYIGIYRYLEIYLIRRKDFRIAGYEIKKNASGRFRNFAFLMNIYQELLDKHYKRYRILDDFCDKYNLDIENNLKIYSEVSSKPPEIIAFVYSLMTEGISFDKINSQISKLSDKKFVNNFISGFLSELRETSWK